MIGHRFINFNPQENSKSKFEQLLDIFTQLLTYTSGDATEARDWLNQLDRTHKLTDDDYGIGDFIEDLKQNGYLKENPQDGRFAITSKTEQTIRQKSLEEIFGKLKKGKQGNHSTTKAGPTGDINSDTRSFQFGDLMEQINFTESIKNAQINRGIDSFSMQEHDLVVQEAPSVEPLFTTMPIPRYGSVICRVSYRPSPERSNWFTRESRKVLIR